MSGDKHPCALVLRGCAGRTDGLYCVAHEAERAAREAAEERRKRLVAESDAYRLACMEGR